MSKQSGFIEIAVVGGLVFMAIIATAIYAFIAQPHQMSGSSMMPTIHDQEYFITNKLDKNFQRGDIVIFRNPQDETQDFIKRIVAISGDKVMLKDGKLLVNDQPEPDSYILPGSKTNPNNFLLGNQAKYVPEDGYFLLGDNREHSIDSRSLGFIQKDKIIGKYWISYYK